MNASKSSQVSILTQVVRQLRDDGCEFFVNSKNEPTVKIPDDGFQQEWSADSQRVGDLITTIYCDLTKNVLRTSDRDFVMVQLREECRKGGRRLAETEVESTDRDALVQAMLYFVNERQEFKSRTIDLMKAVVKIQKTGKITLGDEIPEVVNIFSRRLKRLIPTLNGYGIEVYIEHKESGSHCSVRRLPEFQPEDSDGNNNKPSGQNPMTGKDLPSSDGSDDTIRTDAQVSAPRPTSKKTKGGE